MLRERRRARVVTLPIIGGFLAAFIISQVISIGGYYESTEWAYVIAFVLFIVMMFVRPRGILGR